MRQLFICTSNAAVTATGNPQDLTNVVAGSIGMWQNGKDSAWLSTTPTADFSIAYGRPNSQAIVIPVDFASARVTISTFQKVKTLQQRLLFQILLQVKIIHFSLLSLVLKSMSVILGLLQIMVHIRLLLLIWQSHLVANSLI